MMRTFWTQCLMVGLVSFPGASREVFAGASWKLYDLRDLVSALPPAPKTGNAVPEPGANVDDLLGRVCGTLGASCTRLVTGVFGIEAEDADHARLLGMLEAIRNLYRERYAIELVLYQTPADHAPSIGAEVQNVSPMASQRFVVSRRTPTPVAALSQITFLSGASPVVATNAAVYAPEKTMIDSGLDVRLLVGADGADQDGATSIEIHGELRKVAWPDDGTEFEPFQGGKINLKFPVAHVRSIQSFLRIKSDKLIVFNVLMGFEEGNSIVVAASVRKL